MMENNISALINNFSFGKVVPTTSSVMSEDCISNKSEWKQIWVGIGFYIND